MSTGPRVVPIPRVSGLSLEQFEREYRFAGKPVVLTGKMDHWPALARWNLDSLRDRFGDLRVAANVDLPEDVPYFYSAANYRRETTFGEFVDLLKAGPAKPCYLAQLMLSQLPGTVDEVDFASLHSERADHPTVAIWVGSANTRSGMHFDGNDNLYAQVLGRKRIVMAHPDEAPRLYPFKFDFCKSPVEAEAPDLQRYPRLAEATLWQVDLAPGEILFMPRIWWHQLRSLEPSISLSYHYGEVFRFGEHARVLNRLGVGYWTEILKQFVVNGMFGVKTDIPLYSQPVPGKMFYDYVKEQLSSRREPGDRA
jgi:Cupin-like domain